MPDVPDLEHLLRLLAVREAGSFAGAARALGTSRQAIHRSIDELERWVGTALVDRDSSGVRVTALGQQLIQAAEATRAAQHGARAALRAVRQNPGSTIKIIAPPLFADVMLPQILGDLQARLPMLRILLRVEAHRTELVRDDVDLMIRVGAAPEPHHLAKRLAVAPLVLCASPPYLARHAAPTHPQDLAHHRLLEYAPTPSEAWLFHRDNDSYSVPVSPHLSSDAVAVLVASCRAGLGLLRVPRLAVAEALAHQHLVPVMTAWAMASPPIWAIYGHRTPQDPALAALLDALLAAFPPDNPDNP